MNTILARGGGNLNDPIFKSSNARGLPGGGMLKFRVDRRITEQKMNHLEFFVPKLTLNFTGDFILVWNDEPLIHTNYIYYHSLTIVMHECTSVCSCLEEYDH